MSFRYVVNPQHLFALKWSLRYLPSYFSAMRGDFDFKHHCLQLASFQSRPRTGRKQDPSFFRTWAAPFLTFPDIPGQLSIQELVQQLWEALSKADPAEYIHLVSQDLSGFFTSIPTERFHQALQVLLHRYDQVVGLRRSSQWSVYEVKSDHRRRMFKGKWRRQTKVPRTFVNKTSGTSWTLSLTTVTSGSTATCSGKNVESLWDHQQHHRSAIWLPRWRTSSGTKQCVLCVFACPMSVWSGMSATSTIVSFYYVTLPHTRPCS